MLKLVILFILSSHVMALKLSEEQNSLLKKIGNYSDFNNDYEIKPPKLRFEYKQRNFAPYKYTAVLKKGSSFQTLNGEQSYESKYATVVKVEEVSPGSPFTYLMGKDGKPAFVCRTKDLEVLDEVVSLTPKKVNFIKDNYQYKYIDNDKNLLLNLLVSQGNHSYEIFEENEVASSFGLTAELGMESSLQYPMMVIGNISQMKSTNFNWVYANIGIKVSRLWDYSELTKIGGLVQAERTLYGQADLKGNSIKLKANRFSLGPLVQYKDNLFSLEYAVERLMFPASIQLNSNGIQNTENFHSSIIFKVGKQFEIEL